MSCSIWYSAPGLWIGGDLESRCIGRLYGADSAVRVASNASDDGRMRPKHTELRINQ